jgi:hypothetical protein
MHVDLTQVLSDNFRLATIITEKADHSKVTVEGVLQRIWWFMGPQQAHLRASITPIIEQVYIFRAYAPSVCLEQLTLDLRNTASD